MKIHINTEKKKLNGYDNPSYVTTKIVKETDRAI